MSSESLATSGAAFSARRLTRSDRVYLVLSGDFDLAARQLLLDLVDRARPLTLPVLIDLAEVEFIDSSGIGALLCVEEAARVDDVGRVTITGMRPAVRRTLDIAGVLRRFNLG
jgi:anti-anti-sigma factor